MSEEQIFTSEEEFILKLKELGIQKIAFSEINERRAMQTTGDQIEVLVFRKVDLLSYRDSIIYKYTAVAEDLNPIYERLVNEGFEVKRINKNIT